MSTTNRYGKSSREPQISLEYSQPAVSPTNYGYSIVRFLVVRKSHSEMEIKMSFRNLTIGIILVSVTTMNSAFSQTNRNFGQDVQFLREHLETIVLSAGDARVAVVPAYQGRVMTSSLAGDDGLSFGWINYELIASGQIVPHMNAFGGEDRFWIGPEGGQFSVFFPGGKPFEFDYWQTPPLIDSEPYDVVEKTPEAVKFGKVGHLVNYSGTQFDFEIERNIRLLDPAAAAKHLGVDLSGVKMVSYQSENTIRNTGKLGWTQENGLLSIWILSMYNPSPKTTVVVPFEKGPEDKLGPIVNDAYFGKIPADRLVVKNGVIFFSADGKQRGKIGLSPNRAKPALGSYDAQHNVLTIVQYTKPAGAIDYVNSMWKLQDDPFGGDTVNSYNDGPVAPSGKPLGPFYELETSSPAAALAPGESITHVHRSFHFQGDRQKLDVIAQAVLGVTIEEIENGLKHD